MESFITGTFIEECKNRFLCLVKVKKETHLCYVASSARLENFLELKGKRVLLMINQGNKTRTDYTLFAVKQNAKYIVLNLAVANKFLADLLRSEYTKRIEFIREKIVNLDYKCDLYITTTPPVLVEAKSIISDKETVAFPSVIGDRAMKQFNALYNALEQGYRVRYCLVLLTPTIISLIANDSAKEFYMGLVRAMEAGMSVEIYRIRNTRKLRFYLERDYQIERDFENDFLRKVVTE